MWSLESGVWRGAERHAERRVMWSDVEWWGMSSDMDTIVNTIVNTQYIHSVLYAYLVIVFALR